jgi:prepilin-type N-terminal cleavage/methylation domain-containing protein
VTGLSQHRILARLSDGRAPRSRCFQAFSLIELVIVIVILGIVAAIAIPRLSRGSQGSADAATVQNVALLQKAIDLYAAEHNGAYPDPNLISEQLTLYTDTRGVVSKTKAPPYSFGPYMRAVPPVPIGRYKGSTVIGTESNAGIGWLYNHAEGAITANTGEDKSLIDASGMATTQPATVVP